MCVYPADMKEPSKAYIFACISNSQKKGMTGWGWYNRIMLGEKEGDSCVAHIAKGGLFIYLLLLLLMGRPWAFDRRVSNPFETTGMAPALTCWITFSFRLNIFLSPFLLYSFFPFSFFFLSFPRIYIFRRMKWGEADIIGSNGDFFLFSPSSSYKQEY